MTPEKFKRKLTAILSADVKGYSRLIGEDEPLGKEFCRYGFVSGMIPYQTGVATARYAFQNLGKSWMKFPGRTHLKAVKTIRKTFLTARLSFRENKRSRIMGQD